MDSDRHFSNYFVGLDWDFQVWKFSFPKAATITGQMAFYYILTHKSSQYPNLVMSNRLFYPRYLSLSRGKSLERGHLILDCSSIPFYCFWSPIDLTFNLVNYFLSISTACDLYWIILVNCFHSVSTTAVKYKNQFRHTYLGLFVSRCYSK